MVGVQEPEEDASLRFTEDRSRCTREFPSIHDRDGRPVARKLLERGIYAVETPNQGVLATLHHELLRLSQYSFALTASTPGRALFLVGLTKRAAIEPVASLAEVSAVDAVEALRGTCVLQGRQVLRFLPSLLLAVRLTKWGRVDSPRRQRSIRGLLLSNVSTPCQPLLLHRFNFRELSTDGAVKMKARLERALALLGSEAG